MALMQPKRCWKGQNSRQCESMNVTKNESKDRQLHKEGYLQRELGDQQLC